MCRTVHTITTVFLILLSGSRVANAALPADFGDSPIVPGVFKSNIKTVNIHREGWNLSYPVIDLNGPVKLIMSFDDLSSEIRNYYYRIVLCNADWTPSSLNENEYLEGYLQNQISDYEHSFNTYFNYIHYSLKLPNDDVRFKVSGNYAIILYSDYNEDDTVFIKRFFVAEKLVDVKASIQRPSLSVFRDAGQEVNFTVSYGSFPVRDPYSEVKITVLQNGRWDNANTGLKPLYDRDGVLDYDYNTQNVFPGGDEFRWFDMKSFRYQSPYIKDVEFKQGHFYVDLFPDLLRGGKMYFYEQDLNGRYYVEVQEENDNDTDADYAYVNFTLSMDELPDSSSVYVMGDLTNWIYDDQNKMTYNADSSAYKLTLLLKQGYYNYEYGVKKKGADTVDIDLTEGNHYETENDYIILVYFHSTTSRHERLIGYQIANSLNQDKDRNQ